MLTAQFHHDKLYIVLIVFVFSLALNGKLSLTLFHDAKLFFQAIFYKVIYAQHINNFNCLGHSLFFGIIHASILTSGNHWADLIFTIQNFILTLIEFYPLSLHNEINLLFNKMWISYIYTLRQLNLRYQSYCPQKNKF